MSEVLDNWVGSPVEDIFWRCLEKWVEEGKVRIPRFRVIEGLSKERVEESLIGHREGKPADMIVHPHGEIEAQMSLRDWDLG